jgi:imidazolonepropionase-like amidohydrolase
MKLVKCSTLYDGIDEKSDCYVGFEGDEIKYVGKEATAQLEGTTEKNNEIIAEGNAYAITPGFIDAHSHIGLVRSGEPDKEEEANERFNPIYPLVNALHSIYMDDPSFSESVEGGVLYSTVLPGSGNIIGGKAVLIRNFAKDIGESYMGDVGIKMALGYNPRSTTEWKGDRPSTRMGAIAMLRENLLKARKMQHLLQIEKKVAEEVDPLTEVFMDILSNKYKMMVHLHKEDDAIVLIQLTNEFGIKAIANHCADIHREEVFAALKTASIPVVYGPMDSFPYKVELKHESWRNVEKLIVSKAKFSFMSDHPVILQRNLFYTLRHLLRFGMSKAEAISKISKEAADIIGVNNNIGQVKAGYKASFTVWNGDPFSLSSYPVLVVAEGRIVYQE